MIRKEKIKRGKYWAIRIDGKYILEHRFVVQNILGRKLTSQEAVHHINHDESDNRPENLQLFATHGEHTKIGHPEVARNSSIREKGKHRSKATEFKKGDPRIMGNKSRLGIPAWNKGKAWPEEIRKKMSLAHMGKHKPNIGSFTKGQPAWNKGKPAPWAKGNTFGRQ